MNNYFPHDSNSRNSDKLLPVRMKFGAEGYGIYFMLLERLRDEKNYTSVKDYNMLAFDLRVDTSKVKSIIEDFGLFAFTDDGECFYSEGFNKRMEIKDERSKKRSEAGKKGAAKRWQTDSNAITMPNNSNSKETKVKETKDKKNTAKSSQLAEDFDKLWKLYPRKERRADAFKAYQKAIKEGATNKEIQDGIVAYKRSVQGFEPKFIAQGGTWFNGQRWKDDYKIEPIAPVADYNLEEARKAYEQ